MKQEKQKIISTFSGKDNFLITTFEIEKLESLAAILALEKILKNLGKNCYLFIGDSPAKDFSFLPDAQNLSTELSGNNLLIFVQEKKAKLKKLLWDKKGDTLKLEIVSRGDPFSPQDVSFGYEKPQIDYMVVLGSPRFAAIEKLAKFKDKPVINIDWRKDNDLYGSINWINKEAYTLAEMIISLIEALNQSTGKILQDKDVATLLYASVLWRTKGFSGNIPSKVFSVLAQLLSWGAEKTKIDQYFWRSMPAELVPIFGKILESMQSQNNAFIFSLKKEEFTPNKDLILEHIKLIINELKQRVIGLNDLVLLFEDEDRGLIWAILSQAKITELSAFVDWKTKNRKINQGELLGKFEEDQIRIKQELF